MDSKYGAQFYRDACFDDDSSDDGDNNDSSSSRRNDDVTQPDEAKETDNLLLTPESQEKSYITSLAQGKRINPFAFDEVSANDSQPPPSDDVKSTQNDGTGGYDKLLSSVDSLVGRQQVKMNAFWTASGRPDYLETLLQSMNSEQAAEYSSYYADVIAEARQERVKPRLARYRCHTPRRKRFLTCCYESHLCGTDCSGPPCNVCYLNKNLSFCHSSRVYLLPWLFDYYAIISSHTTTEPFLWRIRGHSFSTYA